MSTEKGYNGWRNRQTWNVSLWIGSDESLYSEAVAYVKRCKARGRKPRYGQFIVSAGLVGERTPDNISFSGTKLDRKALSEMLAELVS